MASDGTIDSELFVLVDGWPGVPNPSLGEPTDGFTGADHHDVSTAAYPLGTKIQVWNDGAEAGVDGWATLIYLKLTNQDGTNVLGARHIVALSSAAEPYGVTNEQATLLTTQLGPIAIALSAMGGTDATPDVYGWFWCGGVCPEEYVSDLGGNYKTLNPGTVAIGGMTYANGTAGTTYGELAFDVRNAVAEQLVGFALAADTDGA
jgi:hypothetical protein